VKFGLTSREEHTLRVFKNSVLRKIFGPKRDEVAGDCRRLHNKEVYDTYFSQNILVNKSRRIRWVGYVASMENSGGTGFWLGELKESHNLEDLGIDGRIVLKWIFKKWDEEPWTEFVWLRIKTSDRHW
jgi:hypothetical protein